MLTIIFLAMVMTIVTISYVRLSVNEQRQSTDDDLNTRAFYAAESGIEDGKRAIQAYLNNSMTEAELNGDVCAPPASSSFTPVLDSDGDSIVLVSEDPNVDSAYTCHFIDMAPGDVRAELTAWGDSLFVPLRTANNDPFDRVVISWHEEGDDQPDSYNNASNNSKSLPQTSAWDLPAMLRTRLFSVPSAGFSRNDIDDQMGFLNPSSASDAISVSNLDRSIFNVVCNQSLSEYNCSATITGINSSRLNYLRIQALYQNTHIRVQLFNGSGTPVVFEDVQAEIDVTGRANDVFKRLQARVSLAPEDPFELPDYALLSGEDICKNFLVTDDPSDFSGLNPTISGANSNSSCR